MKFSKHNNPRKKHGHKKSPYSKSYINERQNEMYALLADAKTEAERDAIIKAFQISVNP